MPYPIAGALVYFLHIMKTAGVSLSAFLGDTVGPDGAASNRLWDHLAAEPQATGPHTRVVAGHFGGLLPLWLGRWPRVLTAVREPVVWALSHIHHVQRAPCTPCTRWPPGLSVAEYCRHPVLRKTVDNLQARYLATLSFSRAVVPYSADEGAAARRLLAPPSADPRAIGGPRPPGSTRCAPGTG